MNRFELEELMPKLFFFIFLYLVASMHFLLLAQAPMPTSALNTPFQDDKQHNLQKEKIFQTYFSGDESIGLGPSNDVFYFYQAVHQKNEQSQITSNIKKYAQLAEYYASMKDFEKAYFYSNKVSLLAQARDSLLISPQKATFRNSKYKINTENLSQPNKNALYPLPQSSSPPPYFVAILIFLLVSVSLIAAILVSFFYKISQKRKKLNHILEEKVAQKTKHLLKTIATLEETNKDLDTFLYKASHDLKGPLTTLDGLCNIGLMEVENQTAHEYLTMQKRVIQNLQLLLFRIVEIGNIRHHENNLQPILLNRLCNRLTRSMRREEGFENVRFKVNVPEDLSIETDQEMLEITLDNLLKNALQHANYQLHRRGEVTLSVATQKEAISFTVHDNGQGILPEIQHKIFDMFFRGTDHFKGFGLGLYKAKIATHKLGGEISLKHSQPGDTLFEVRLPFS